MRSLGEGAGVSASMRSSGAGSGLKWDRHRGLAIPEPAHKGRKRSSAGHSWIAVSGREVPIRPAPWVPRPGARWPAALRFGRRGRPSLGGLGLGLRKAHDRRLVAGRLQEPEQILPGDRGRHGVYERMEIDSLVLQEVRVEDHRDAAGPVVYDREGSDRARLDAQHVTKLIRRAERHPPRSPDSLV